MKIQLRQIIEESSKKNNHIKSVPCTGIKEHKGFSCHLDTKKNEYFIATHRARSKGYESLSNIPMKVINFIDSTG